jgi:GAF domain-containing protein
LHQNIAKSLQEVAVVLNTNLDSKKILSMIIDQLSTILEFDRAGIILLEDDELVIRHGKNLPETLIGRSFKLTSNDPVVRVFKNSKPIILEDVHIEPSWTMWSESVQIRSWMGVPMYYHNRAIGLLSIDSFKKGTYNSEHVRFFMSFAYHAAAAIVNAKNLEQRTNLHKRAEILRQNNQVLTQTLDLTTIMENLLNALEELTQFDSTKVDNFSNDHIQLAEAVAAQASFAIQNARLYKLTENQREQAELTNLQTIESMQYAHILQSSLLLSRDFLNKKLPHSFFLWEPRDIVGGDLYLVENCNDNLLIILIDCTGHGVPGAFMTILVASAIKRSLQDIDCSDAAGILKYINTIVKSELCQDLEGTGSDDGLEASICILKSDKNEMIYAGARLPLMIVEKNRLSIIRGENHSLGYKKSKLTYTFQNHIIHINNVMMFYLASDGYYEQIGGEKGFPMGRKQFQINLVEVSNFEMSKQKVELRNKLQDFQGERNILDDITVIGFRVFNEQ